MPNLNNQQNIPAVTPSNKYVSHRSSTPPLWKTHENVLDRKDLAFEYDLADTLIKEGSHSTFNIDGLIYRENGQYGPYWEMYISCIDMATFGKGKEAKPITVLYKVYMNSNSSIDDIFNEMKDDNSFPVGPFRLELVHFTPKGGKRKIEKTFYRLADGSEQHETTSTEYSPFNELVNEPDNLLGDLDEHPF